MQARPARSVHASPGWGLCVLVLLAGCGGPAPLADLQAASVEPFAWTPIPQREPLHDPCPARPVVFVHGMGGRGASFATMKRRLVRDGWRPRLLLTRTFPNPQWGSNVRNAKVLLRWVRDARNRGAGRRVDVVAHSMGNLSTRYFLLAHDGAEMVRNYVSLGGMHHGLQRACTAPAEARVFRELCSESDFIATINRVRLPLFQTSPVSIAGARDRVVPLHSALLRSASLIILPKVTHRGPRGLLEDPSAYEVVRDALRCRWARSPRP